MARKCLKIFEPSPFMYISSLSVPVNMTLLFRCKFPFHMRSNCQPVGKILQFFSGTCIRPSIAGNRSVTVVEGFKHDILVQMIEGTLDRR